jgi:preprotein translocase subunit SecF
VITSFPDFCLSNGNFITVLAANLAVLGYSVNESVVISFDRIRENFRRYRKMQNTEEIIDNAITSTIS